MSSLITFNYKAIGRLLGILILVLGISMIIPWIYAEVTHDPSGCYSFRRCAPLTMAAGALIIFSVKSQRAKFRPREGYIVVAAAWLLCSLIGAFPYYLSDFTGSYVNAFFESTSGFTTTGCTAEKVVLSHTLLLWKAITHWLGGMGILILVISILPALGINGQYIAKAEAPGPIFEKMTVRVSDSAKVLYLTYIAFSILEFVLLMLSGKMTAFDALIATTGSISTSGLTCHAAGIAYYDSLYIEIVISVFCFLASVNFILYFYLVTGRGKNFLRDPEFRAFVAIILFSIFVCTVSMVFVGGYDFNTALRNSFFQVISLSTTSGYLLSPDILWPTTCQIILLTVMLIGGCSSSTSGSLKVSRVLVMLKLIKRGGIKRIHPRSVVAVKIGKNAVPAPIVSGITVFISTYIVILLFSFLVLSTQGLDLQTTFSSALALLSNTGMVIGPTESVVDFSVFHPVLRLYLSGLMIIGRLEMFPIIILLTRHFWGKAR